MVKKGTSENPAIGQCYTCEWKNYFLGCSGDDSEEGFWTNLGYISWLKQ